MADYENLIQQGEFDPSKWGQFDPNQFLQPMPGGQQSGGDGQQSVQQGQPQGQPSSGDGGNRLDQAMAPYMPKGDQLPMPMQPGLGGDAYAAMGTIKFPGQTGGGYQMPGDWRTFQQGTGQQQQQTGQRQQMSDAEMQQKIMSMFSGGMTPEALKAAQKELNAMGIHIQNEERGDVRPRLLLPNGRTVDLGDWGGAAKWVDRGDMGDWHSAYSGGGGAGGSGVGGGGGPSSGGGFGGGFLGSAISRLINRGFSPVSRKDPLISGATAAYRGQTDRAMRKARNTMAERAAQRGLNSGGAGSGAFDSGLQSMLEHQGQDVGGYESGLMLNEDRMRRQELMNALGMGIPMQQFYDQFAYGMGRDNNNTNMQYLMSLLGGG